MAKAAAGPGIALAADSIVIDQIVVALAAGSRLVMRSLVAAHPIEGVVGSRKIAGIVAHPNCAIDPVVGLALIYAMMKIHQVAADSRCTSLRCDV